MILLVADYVGFHITDFLCRIKEQIDVLVYDRMDCGGYNDHILTLIKDESPSTNILSYDELCEQSRMSRIMECGLDFGVLAWWPYIIPEQLIKCTKMGFINTHPGFLPYNRGKHPYFWSIVDGTPFGVTIHWVDEKIDNGKILVQKEIPVTWEDTGESLYLKAREEILHLFYENYSKIRSGEIVAFDHGTEAGTFHFGNQLEPFCTLDLDGMYTARKLLNIMRGRMFKGVGRANFTDEGRKYYLSVEIKEADSGE